MTPIFIRSASPLGQATTNVRVDDGKISAVGATLVESPQDTVIEAHGCVLLPGLVDAHAHIDKTLWGAAWQPHTAGPSVLDRIDYECSVRETLQLSPAVQSARLLEHMLSRGTTHVRTHVDIGPHVGLTQLHGVQATREQYRDVMGLQVVAFPQLGVTSVAGTLALLDDALRAGADVVGGIDPVGVDRDPKGQLDGLFDLAHRHGCGIDIHLHDQGEAGAVTIEMAADRSRALGMRGEVVISHGFCLGSVAPARLARLIECLLDQDIAIMTHGPSGGTPSPPLRALQAQGVRVFSGSDGVRDAWGPLNTGDMLERAFMVAYINGFRDDAGLELALDMSTTAGAQVLGLQDYGIDVGCDANLILVQAETLAEVVAAHPRPNVVIANGQIVARDGRATAALASYKAD